MWFSADTEPDSEAFSSHVTDLVQKLTTDTEAAQKLIAASVHFVACQTYGSR